MPGPAALPLVLSCQGVMLASRSPGRLLGLTALFRDARFRRGRFLTLVQKQVRARVSCRAGAIRALTTGDLTSVGDTLGSTSSRGFGLKPTASVTIRTLRTWKTWGPGRGPRSAGLSRPGARYGSGFGDRALPCLFLPDGGGLARPGAGDPLRRSTEIVD